MIELSDRFTALSTPTPEADTEWRIDGQPFERNGEWFCRCVNYVETIIVWRQLNHGAGIDWSTRLEAMPPAADGDGAVSCSVKCSLTVLGCTREGIGTGKDWKSAESDSLKRAARLFGICDDLWLRPPVIVRVEMNERGRFKRMLEQPADVYRRMLANPKQTQASPPPVPSAAPPKASSAAPAATGRTDVRFILMSCKSPNCPSGRLYDNRHVKTGRQPDFVCVTCRTGHWLTDEKTRAEYDRVMAAKAVGEGVPAGHGSRATTGFNDSQYPDALRDNPDGDDLPF